MSSPPRPRSRQTAKDAAAAPESRVERKLTILDVARRARVAVGTASRVINGAPNVSEDKRNRVNTAIRELGYAPNIVAQSMRSNRSMTFACVMRDFTVPVLSMFVESMQKEVDAFGFSLMVGSSYHDVNRELTLLKGFQQRRIDGLVIATSSESDPALLAALSQLEFPVVLIDRDRPADLDAVRVNHAAGMRQAVRYLMELGHKRIGFLSGEQGLHPARSRAEGFRQGMQDGGATIDPALLSLTSFGGDSAYAETHRLLSLRKRPTAIIAGGSALLPGVIRAARDLGLAIPRDLSVIAGADSDLAQLGAPPFTVVRWSHDQLGKAAGGFLMKRLDDPGQAPQRLTVDAELVVRGSCAVPSRTRAKE